MFRMDSMAIHALPANTSATPTSGALSSVASATIVSANKSVAPVATTSIATSLRSRGNNSAPATAPTPMQASSRP